MLPTSGGARFPPIKWLALPTEGLIVLENDRPRGRQGIVTALETEGERCEPKNWGVRGYSPGKILVATPVRLAKKLSKWCNRVFYYVF